MHLLLDQRDNVAVVNILLLVGQLFEFVEHLMQRFAAQRVA